jgi:hypothetical protein
MMELSDLSYKIYRASSGRSSFWRWDVYKKGLKAPIKSEFVYGTMADAKKHASAAILKFANTEKMHPQNKT